MWNSCRRKKCLKGSLLSLFKPIQSKPLIKENQYYIQFHFHLDMNGSKKNVFIRVFSRYFGFSSTFWLIFMLYYSNGNNLLYFRRVQKDVPPLPPQKSVFVAYLFWLFLGPLGGHHLYLHRDREAFIWWCTLGGYFGLGWIWEVLQIPEMVRDANEDPAFIERFVYKLRVQRRPEFSTSRFVWAIMIGYLWGQLFMLAIPTSLVGGIDWGFLHWFVPLAGALGT